MAVKSSFTRMPKANDLVPQLREAGCGLHVLPTYLALLDHCDNKTGRAWPSINRLSDILGLCRRTVERHIKALCEAGLVLRNDQQRGRRGRFSTRRYVVVAVLFFTRATVRHQGRTNRRSLYKRRTKAPLNSQNPVTDGYEWLFGKDAEAAADEEYRRQRQQKRQEEAKRRREGSEWLFG